ncbi:uncharacterized protein si:ch73-248e21.5 [Megalops cyprinoides]|uniref:uncharacterized protein si:ch73-248e21.5 n=1 Tax=Megalops cyprinoides TaxID=118141 RepID=UPI001864AAFA|nr:uncharacterized protein si:ch73-248e21.5 [Megalops cyprinoides]
MREYNNQIMRMMVWLLFVCLPHFPAVSVPVYNYTTEAQYDLKEATTAQSLTTDVVRNLLKVPYVTTDHYSTTPTHATGTSERTGNTAGYGSHGFDRKIAPDFYTGITTPGSGYIITTVASGRTEEQKNNRNATLSDSRIGKTQSFIFKITSSNRYNTELTTDSSTAANQWHSDTVKSLEEREAATVNQTTVWNDASTSTTSPHTEDIDFSNDTVTPSYLKVNEDIISGDYSTTTLHTSFLTDTERDDGNTRDDSSIHTSTGSRINTDTNDHTIILYRLTTKELERGISEPTQQITQADNSTDSHALNNNTFPHTSQPNCENKEIRSSSRSTRLVCFITLWALGVTASIFCGITVYLWVRLSFHRKMERTRRERRVVEAAESQVESLWVAPIGTVQDRVEFWYANGASSGLVNQRGNEWRDRRNGGKERMRGNERGGMRETESFWIQPKVTVEQLTEFWYARVKQGEEHEQP